MNATNEQALYRDGNDLVTETRAVLGTQTFDLADISTVSIVPPIVRREYGYGLIALGIVLAILGYVVWGVFLTPMLVGVVLVVVGIGVIVAVRPTYTVRLNRTNGQTTMVQFPDRSRAEQVVAALSRALSRNH